MTPETTQRQAAAPDRQAWIGAALLAGVAYFVIGKVFALPADHARAWRLAAWVVSGGVYAAHIAYEHFRRRDSLRLTASRVALGVALGAFGLAVAGMMHSYSATSAVRPAWLLALVLWPAFTAVPAFVGALIAGAVLARLARSTDTE